MSKRLTDVFDIANGASGLLSLMNMYEKNMRTFKGQGAKYPVTILTDNDDGSSNIKSRIKKKLDDVKEVNSSLHYNFARNLYIIFTPETEGEAIEDLFDEETLNTEIDGKVFSRANEINSKTEYGKIVFAEKVIKAKQKEINFDGFKVVFDKIKLIINEYSKKNA